MDQIATLYIDDRERAVTIHREIFGDLPINISRITIGDYAVCVNDAVVAVFERKSLEDLAASIKDGRYDNKQSLIDLRERSACRVYYIIEGKPPKDPSHRVGGIPWACLESALDHMTIRDGFNMLYTKDTVDTARRLTRVTRSIQTLIRSGELEVVDGSTVGLLTEKREIRDEDVVRSMWCKFKGIAATTADVFMKRWKLRDVIRGGVDLKALAGVTMPDGRLVSKRVIGSLGKIDEVVSVNLLSCIPGVSKKMAQDLLKGKTLAALLSYSIGALSIVKVGRPAKNFGETRAERVMKYFEYIFIPEELKVEAPIANPPVPPPIDPAALNNLFEMLGEI